MSDDEEEDVLTPEDVEMIEAMLPSILGRSVPELEKNLGTTLDPTSLVLGSFIALLHGDHERINEFLSRPANRKILIGLRGEGL